jgi:hypothetical protein
MSDKWQLGGGAVATVKRPRVVLVGGANCVRVAEQLRKLDWEVVVVPAGDDLACAVVARKPSVVVLPVETGWESGFLVAAKLRAARKKLRVVLVAKARTPEAERFARFVGAALVTDADGPAKLVNAVTG